MSSKPKIGIVITTTRHSRFGDTPAQWIHAIAQKETEADFELVDLRDYPMPLFDEKTSPVYAPPENAVAKRWGEKMATFDGYLFVTAEYNHSVSGALKNALDYLAGEVKRKPASFVGYGAAGATRAIEHLRGILAEMHVATTKFSVNIGMTEMLGMLRQGKTMADYPYLDDTAKPMLADLIWWTKALKAAREAA